MATTTAPSPPAAARLSTLDRWLPVWIGAAMVAGLLLGRSVPGLAGVLESIQVDGISLPIAVGLLVMMYPVLAKVRYDRLGAVTSDRRLLVGSLVLNWVVGPALMFALAWTFLPDLPEYRTGLIVVGLARCIAMVIIWNDLACGDREAAAVLVALNSVFQVIAFAGLGWFYLQVLPVWLGLVEPGATGIDASTWDIARSVLVFLGVPLLAGYLTRRLGERARGRTWYEERFLPRIGPFALYALLFTIVVLFALQGDQITSRPGDVARIALPLLVYFAVMWGGGYLAGRLLGLGYERTTTLAFTAAGNNFELAIAVSIATFGLASGQALAGVVGPAHRGPRAGRPRLRQPRPAEPVPPRGFSSDFHHPPNRGAPMTRPSVLFVCVHNAGRSQMAAAYLHHLSGGEVEVRSAGSAPADTVNPAVVEAMAEEGIDLTAETPKILTREAVQASDVVITMGCGDACPIFPGKRYEDWVLEDPAGQGVDSVRPIRDEIRSRVSALVAELGVAPRV